MTKKELWLRIKNYHFEHIVPPTLLEKIGGMFGGVDAATKAFADKIARKHTLKKRYSLRAVMEYKKFIYLAVVSDYQVTPPKMIDVVWHEHILFTEAYNIFCTNIIEYKLNHHPELIPLAEQTELYHAQYLATINLYIEEFGILPIEDIWDITKYDKTELLQNIVELRKKKRGEPSNYSNNSYYSDAALYSSFSSQEINSNDFGEFNGFGGGEGGGGGANGDWGSDDSDGDGGSDGGGDGGGCGGGD